VTEYNSSLRKERERERKNLFRKVERKLVKIGKLKRGGELYKKDKKKKVPSTF
jgi:hypothetical protein